MRHNIKRSFSITMATILFAIGCSTAGTLFSGKSVSAASGDLEYKKALATAAVVCMTNSYMRTEFTAAQYEAASNKGGYIFKTDKKMTIPYGYNSSTQMKCSEIVKVALGAFPTNVSDIPSYLNKLGYEKTSSGGGKCFEFHYNSHWTQSTGNPFAPLMEGDQAFNTKRICVTTDENGIITSTKPEIKDGSSTMGEYIKFTAVDKGVKATMKGTNAHTQTYTDATVEVWANDLKLGMLQQIGSSTSFRSGEISIRYWLDESFGTNGILWSDYGDSVASYKLSTDKAVLKDKAEKLFIPSTGMTYDGYDHLKYALYQNYLVKYYKINEGAYRPITAEGLSATDAAKANGDGYKKVYVASAAGKFEECYVKASANTNKAVPAIGPNGLFTHAVGLNGAYSMGSLTKKFDEIISDMNTLAGSMDSTHKNLVKQYSDAVQCGAYEEQSPDPENPTPNPPSPGPGDDDPGDETTGETPWCYQEAKTLGCLKTSRLIQTSPNAPILYTVATRLLHVN